jgi:hypothetical protein
MRKVIELLNRWYKRLSNNLSNDIEVIPISLDTMDTATRLGYEYVRESHVIYDDHILTNLSEQLKFIVMTGGFVGIAYIKGIAAGIIYAQLAIPEIWDTRKTGNVSNLYVKPEYRKNPNVIMALIRSAVTYFESESVEIVRVSCDTQELCDKYVKLFGFKEIYRQVLLEVKE